MAAKKVAEAGFRISGGLFFPLIPIKDFKQIDAVLIETVTGKAFDPTWLRLLNKHGLSNVTTKMGYLAVSIRHARDASVEDVVAFINDLPLLDGITLEIPEDKKAKADGPPTVEDETEN